MNNQKRTLGTSVSGLRQVFEKGKPGNTEDNYNEFLGLGGVDNSRMEDKQTAPTRGKLGGSSTSGLSLPKWEERRLLREESLEAKIWSGLEEETDPLDLSQMAFQDINLVDIIVNAEPKRVWDFCVGYASIAMGRKGDPTEMINIGTNQAPIEVGVYFFAALAIFYNIYQCSIGQIPILQMVSREFKDLMNAASACNRKGNAYTVDWPDSAEAMLRSLPYHSYTNPLITLAPAVGAEDNYGRPILNTTIPSISLEQVIRFGPRAFETIQRYFLFNRENVEQDLVPYTTEGKYYTNVSMFGQPVTDVTQTPIPGVFQVVNEVKIPERDLWLASLCWYSGSASIRTGWNARTVQIGTHLCLYKLLKGRSGKTTECKQALHHMVNVSCGLYSTTANLIAAELNTNDNESLRLLDNQVRSNSHSVILPNLSEITPGEYITWYVSSFIRRFWLGAALCAGTPMPDPQSRVFGAGSRYMTYSDVDNALAPRAMTESLSDLSAFVTPDGVTLNIPVPTIRGTLLSCTMQPSTTVDLSTVVMNTFPTTDMGIAFTANMAAPSSTDLPSVLTFSSSDAYGISYGSAASDALKRVSSALDVLQANLEITTANAGRDGVKSSFLNMTHYLDDTIGTQGYDLSPANQVFSVLNTVPVDPRAFDTVFDSFAPVMFGSRDVIPAFQVVYKKGHRTAVNGDTYMSWRQGYLIQFGHKRSSQPWSGSGTDLHYYREAYMEQGGNVVTKLFAPNGIIHNGAKLLAQGILNFLDNKENQKGLGAKISRDVRGKSEDEVMRMVREGHLNQGHLAPVEHGWISEENYMKAVQKLLDGGYKSKGVVQRRQLAASGKTRKR